MASSEKTVPGGNEEMHNPAADTGNASNPAPQADEPAGANQLLDKKAEKYLREGGNIEDMPDAAEQQEAEEIIKKNGDE